ncbi:uncharacterized protein FTJAE_6236 [Fusarium tjaetaba]|uniref:MYND-type zinc finger protein samB n=1 Tax=Fusarium tjaetaba TaxID=1567544 RepID=A0A8H5VV66_9HYPO|nr:uncharacterized protein FTJAE_6236 [Fusarium tjaetaba]KAF5635615.1 hypothetical protein FTJAE_6236 [Fusarium tjaetaba]
MGSTGKVALPEHWTELSAARVHRQQCADEVDAIKKACLSECEKASVVECEKCFPKVLDRMRARYCDAEGREWFSERRAFLNELDVMFADVKDHKKIDLTSIEDSIASEKEAWYRWVLRMYPQFLSVGEGGADQDELRAMLDDPVKRWEELTERIWEGVGKPANWEADVDSLTDQITAAKNDDAASLKQIYIDFFFKDSQTGEVVENAQQYLEAYAASDAMSIEQVIDRISQDHKASLTTEPQREHHKNRLDELRRAKMAFEQNRLQNKTRAQASQTPAVSQDLYNLPPCAVCAATVDSKDVLSCSVCQALAHMGGTREMTVWCSDECFERGVGDHNELEHDCESGDRCVQYEDEDIEMQDWTRCAASNLARHRHERHGLKTAAYEIKKLAVPLWEIVEKTLKEANPGLKYTVVE